jgi:hypothetical protein
MGFTSRRGRSTHRPVSQMALRLRAESRDDRETAQRYRGPDLDPAAAEAVMDAAFELAVRRRFGATPDRRAVSTFVTGLVRRYQPPRLRAIDMEAVVRAALDEDVSLEGIDRRTVVLTKMLGGPEALQQLCLSDAELDEVLYDAEQLAAERGARIVPATG